MIVQVKSNQAQLLAAVKAVAAEAPALSHVYDVEHRRSRIEQRSVTVYEVGDLTPPIDPVWRRYVNAIITVERDIARFNTRLGDWCDSRETAYYVATTVLPAAVCAQAIRGHWGIENRNHYVRDVTLKEDASRIRRKPGIMARLRSFALNLLRKNNILNVSEALYDNALCLNNLWQYHGIL